MLPNKICPCDVKNCHIFYQATFIGRIGTRAIIDDAIYEPVYSAEVLTTPSDGDNKNFLPLL